MPKEKWHKKLYPHLNKPGDCHRCGAHYQADPTKQKEIELCDTCRELAKTEE